MHETHDRLHQPRLGCVSYLNAKPLIDGLDTHVHFDVPARLLDALEGGKVDLALCPTIDYFRAASPLVLVPVGGICCNGPTLTVRLFSRIPIDRITTVHVDRDSHTSVALLRVLMEKLHNLRPALIDYRAGPGPRAPQQHAPQAMLLIGDKVVTDSPRAIEYPYQLDLGEAWKSLTGLPFVFATWMAAADAELGDLPTRLAHLRARNAGRIDQIVAAYARPHGWPSDLARDYLGGILRYDVGPRELEAVERFGAWAAQLGVIEQARPLTVHAPPAAAMRPQTEAP